MSVPVIPPWQWQAETFLFIALKAWEETLPPNYFTENLRSESDMAQDFGAFLVEHKRGLAAMFRDIRKKWEA